MLVPHVESAMFGQLSLSKPGAFSSCFLSRFRTARFSAKLKLNAFPARWRNGLSQNSAGCGSWPGDNCAGDSDGHATFTLGSCYVPVSKLSRVTAGEIGRAH